MPIRPTLPLLAALALVAPGLARVILAAPATAPTTAATSAMTFPLHLENALDKAGANRAQIELALEKSPAAQRLGMRFLIANMPAIDLQTLSAQFLLDHVAQQLRRVRRRAVESANSAGQIFFNDILPYASLNEKRENSQARC